MFNSLYKKEYDYKIYYYDYLRNNERIYYFKYDKLNNYLYCKYEIFYHLESLGYNEIDFEIIIKKIFYDYSGYLINRYYLYNEIIPV